MTATLLQRLTDEARQRLDSDRFLHVLGVTHTACALAERHGVDVTAAAIAALFHDLSKPIAPGEIDADLAARGVPISAEDRPFPSIWHGPQAAALAAEDPDIARRPDAPAIAEAIRFHSTGEAGMGPLGKILFLADYLEPGRGIEGTGPLLEAAFDDLDAGFARALGAKCRYMKEQGMTISPRAERARRASGETA